MRIESAHKPFCTRLTSILILFTTFSFSYNAKGQSLSAPYLCSGNNPVCSSVSYDGAGLCVHYDPSNGDIPDFIHTDWQYSLDGSSWSSIPVQNQLGYNPFIYVHDSGYYRLVINQHYVHSYGDSGYQKIYTSGAYYVKGLNPKLTSSIVGTSSICLPLDKYIDVSYSVSSIDADNITWTVPIVMQLLSGQGTNSITVRINLNPIGGQGSYTGTITAAPFTSSGCPGDPGETKSLNVSFTVQPATPTISNSRPLTFCTGDSTILTTPSFSGIQWMLNGAAINGAISSTYIAKTSGVYMVQVTNTTNNSGCSSVSLKDVVTVNPLPPIPTISAAGPTTFCSGGSVLLTSSSALSNQWYNNGVEVSGETDASFTANASGAYTDTITNLSGCKSGSQILNITVNLSPLQPEAITGNISVCQGNNQIYSVPSVSSATSYAWTLPSGWTGTSTANSITTTVGSTGGIISVQAINNCGTSSNQTLSVAVNPAPAQPGSIIGNTLVCQNTIQTYSVASVSNATSYTWTLPSGWAGTSTSNSITTTIGSSGGVISVQAINNCGSSSNQTLSVAVNPAPAQPGAVNGNISVCQGSTQTYSVAPVNGATSYIWTLPSGWTGTSATNSIITIIGNSGGTISVKVNNSCGSSNDRTLNVTVNSLPVQPAAIMGNTSVCQGNSEIYSVVPVSGATSYTWILPSGWTGTSTANNITATIGTLGGIISVKANNSCGSSSNQTLNVTVNSAPAQLGAITGNILVCQGTAQTYSVAAVNGATNYTWTLVLGWTGISTTNSITTTVGGSGGTISVKANNTCGSSSNQTLSVAVNPAPTQPGAIKGNTLVCQGANETYSVTSVSGATSYTWTLPTSWTGTSTTNSITTTVGGSTGTISVKVNNSCGSSNNQTLNVTVNPVPSLTLIKDTILSSSIAFNYRWFFNNNIINGETSDSIRVKKTGFYRVETSPDKTCWNPSIDFPILVLPDRLVNDTLSMDIYPNPTPDNFNVLVRLQKVTNITAYVTVSNISGTVVLQTNKFILFSNEVKIPVNLNMKGSFFVKAYINGDVKTMAVIIQ